MSRSDSSGFQPKALFTARVFRGFTISELANKSGVSRQTVNSLESGAARPFWPSVHALADTLSFPPEFFFSPISIPEPGVLHFRRQSRVSARSVEHACAQAALFGRIVDVFREFAEFAAPRVPAVSATDMDGVERAAELFRAGIGIQADAPIANAVRAAEAAGVHVGTFDPGDVPVDGFCWALRFPLILLSTRTCWSRRRFSVMHEVGHLVLHRRWTSENSEEQSHRFAGAVLVPRTAFWREFPRPRNRIEWAPMFEMKHRWGISLQALICRAYDLGIIDAAQYRTANIHVTRFGWRNSEPGESEPESPEVSWRFINDLRQQGEVDDLCAQARLFERNLREVLSIPEEKDDGNSKVVPIPRRPAGADRQIDR